MEPMARSQSQRVHLARSLHGSFCLGYEKIDCSVNADIKEAGARPIASRGRGGVSYWTANRQEAARRVTREDDLITIEELVSDLMDESCTRPATSLAMSSVSKNPPEDDQSKSNTEGSTSNENPKRCSYYYVRHAGDKERCFYLHPELRYLEWRPYNKHILCIDPPQEGAETISNSNYQVGTIGRGSVEGLFISSMAIVNGLGDSN